MHSLFDSFFSFSRWYQTDALNAISDLTTAEYIYLAFVKIVSHVKTSSQLSASIHVRFFFFFIKCMQSMTMILSRCYVYAKLHVTWSKSLLYIFSLINHIDSLCIWACKLSIWSSNHIDNSKLWKLITST